MRAVSCLAAFCLAAALAGCAVQDGFPSLALRPAEREMSMEAPVHAPVAVPADAALRSRVAELQRQAAEGDRAFDASFEATEAAVRAAGPAQSDSWVEAQQALSRLETTREPTTRALSDLDQLAIARADSPTDARDYEALNAVIAAVEQMAGAQQQRIDRLRTRLRAP